VTKTVGTLTDTHMGRLVGVGGLWGVLWGLVPVKDRVQLCLLINGTRVYTDAYPADTPCEVRKPA
jgi:hypothetical protein